MMQRLEFAARRQWLAAVVTGGAILIAACGGSEKKPAASADTPPSAGSAVAIQTFQFQPSPVQVSTGTTVTWTNQDQILHTATSGTPGARDGRFDGTMDGAGKSFSVTFSEPGTYAYYCSRHESMRGEVRVQ